MQAAVLRLFRGTQSTDIFQQSARHSSQVAPPSPSLAVPRQARPGSSAMTLARPTASRATKNKSTPSACTTATLSGPLTKHGKPSTQPRKCLLNLLFDANLAPTLMNSSLSCLVVGSSLVFLSFNIISYSWVSSKTRIMLAL